MVAQMDGAKLPLVGCSGGVYCIFGMHIAEIVVNWHHQHRGILNHWTRMIAIIVVLSADTYVYVAWQEWCRESCYRFF